MMKSPWRKLATLATSALLLTSGLVGVSSPASAAEPSTLFDFESSSVGSDPGSFSGSGGNWSAIVNDQPAGGSVSGTKVAKAQSGAGGYSGTIVGLIGASDSLVGVDTTATLAFYAPEDGKVVRLVVEVDGGGGATVKADATSTTVVGWQLLTFDFSTPVQGTDPYSSANHYNKAWIDYDPSSTAVSSLYYFDNVAFNGAVTPALGTPPVSAPVTLFDYELNAVGYAPGNFSEWFPGPTKAYGYAVVKNTQPIEGSISGTKAVEAQQGNGSYSGTNVGSLAVTDSLIGASRTATMAFWAPEVGKEVYLKVEVYSPNYNGASVTASATTTTVGWQILTFDFASQVASTPAYSSSNVYNQSSLDYDPTSTDVSSVYYFDNVAFNGAVTPALGALQVVAVYDVRLLDSQKDTSRDTAEWLCTTEEWCLNGNKRFFQKMVDAGSTTTLTYVVTDHTTHAAIENATVYLRVNTGYSGSKATWQSGQTIFGPVTGSDDAGRLMGTTDSSGSVSFELTNTNSSGEPFVTLNSSTPYVKPTRSIETKGEMEATVVGATTEYVDVFWAHIASSVMNLPPTPSTVDPDNKGRYAHIRLDKSFSQSDSYDASWWDGVWQYRDVDTKAYLKYIPVRSTFALSYVVTDAYNQPLVGAPVTLIVNANNSCAKTFFSYQGNLIGPDDCSGGGQTELPAQMTDFQGRVTFVLTNTNTKGEAMPSNLSGVPTVGQANEIGTNIKPHLVGATQEGIDMLFAHFVEVTGKPTFSGAAKVTFNTANRYYVGFTLKDASGAPIKNAEIAVLDNDASSSVLYANTDSKGQVMLVGSRKGNRGGTQVIGVSYSAPGELPVTASTTINWVSTAKTATVAGGKRAFTVKIANAKGIRVKIAVAGGGVVYRTPASNAASFKIAAAAGTKSVSVTIAGKTSKHAVKVTK